MIGRYEVDPKKSSVLRQSRRPFSSPSPGYPSSGCSPAEPDSVSPDGCNISSAKLAARLEKQLFQLPTGDKSATFHV